MKSCYKIIFFLSCIILFTQGCSRKKDTFIGRNYHALTTKYNVLYNGNIAFEKGLIGVNNQYTENFWELLPVERMQVKDEVITLGNQANDPSFKISEEKAIKAIQKHGMNIDGREKNPQMDEAYLLLGKSRYYDQRFVPALSALNFIMNKYPTSDKINQVKIWREKANMRMDNNEVAIKKLKRLLDQEELEDQEIADASATLAQAYLNMKVKDTAITLLEDALGYTKIKEQKARYHFIKGQLYNEFEKKDSANIEFDAIIDMHRQVPRAYYINAHLQKSFNFNAEEGNVLEFQEYLTDLEENRENRPFLDKIYYRIAEFHRESEKDSLAEAYYRKSLTKTNNDNHLSALNYETLGNMYFDRNEYKIAGAFYDSTLTVMVEKSKPYRVLEKKRRNLDDVIYYEDVAKENDSILHLVSLPKEEQLALFTEITNVLKEDALEAAKKEQESIEKRENATNNNRNNLNNPAKNIGDALSPKGGNFYFYNSNTVAYGKDEFLKIWGERRLQDNWRQSDQRKNIATKEAKDPIAAVLNDPAFDPQTYIAKIPTDQKVIDSLAKDRNYAYYQLGVIYKEKFKEFELAKSRLETLLENNPENRLILPSKYNLYKIYNELGLTQKAEAIKSDIITTYPESRYAEILLNPETGITKDKNDPEVIYTNLYRQYTNQEYANVIAKAEEQIKKFEGDPLVPKYEMLKASAKGRLYGFEAYREGVNFVALNYPNSEEGKKAQQVLEKAIRVLEKKEFVEDEKAMHFNVIYEFKNNTGEDVNAFTKTLTEEVKDLKYFSLSVSKDVYNETSTFVVIHGLQSLNGAIGFAQLLEREQKDEYGRITHPRITKPYFAISSSNYKIVQRHKNLNAYLKLQ